MTRLNDICSFQIILFICSLSLVTILISFTTIEEVSASSRLDLNRRSTDIDVDIDICIRCDSPVPGPPGPQGPPGEQGPPGDTRQTIIKLEDNVHGQASGWNPDGIERRFSIKPPFEIEQGMSFEFTYISPLQPSTPDVPAAGCELLQIDSISNELDIFCIQPVESFVQNSPKEGATLTYIMTK
jgi:hypothetical protein